MESRMERHVGSEKENKGGKVREGGLERERERKRYIYIQRCDRQSKIKE